MGGSSDQIYETYAKMVLQEQPFSASSGLFFLGSLRVRFRFCELATLSDHPACIHFLPGGHCGPNIIQALRHDGCISKLKGSELASPLWALCGPIWFHSGSGALSFSLARHCALQRIALEGTTLFFLDVTSSLVPWPLSRLSSSVFAQARALRHPAEGSLTLAWWISWHCPFTSLLVHREHREGPGVVYGMRPWSLEQCALLGWLATDVAKVPPGNGVVDFFVQP